MSVSLEKHIKVTFSGFKDKDKTLNNLNEQLTILKNKLNEVNNLIDVNMKSDNDIYNDIEQKNNLQDQIKSLQQQIDNINNDQSEIEFISENGDFIEKYYDNSNDPTIETDTQKNLKETKIETSKNNSILKFFNIKQVDTSSVNQSQIKHFVENQYNNYRNGKITNSDYAVCSNCGSENIINTENNYIVCSVCGLVEQRNMIDQEQATKEVQSKTVYPYKRLNHFIEWLNQLQGKESVTIPMEIYDKITNELNKLGYTNKSEIKLQTIKFILKKYKMNKYYEHASYITSQISGNPPPTLDNDTEKYLKRVFIEIEKSFDKHCPNNRINFLSYSYVLHKIFQLHGNTKVLIYFPLLKSREKIKVQDKIWKEICKDLGWTFYPSI